MSKLGCMCGHNISDQTDNVPYKAHIREDEDVQKPIELLADILAGYYEARQQGQGDQFVKEFVERQLDLPANLIVAQQRHCDDFQVH